jgi:dihydroxycyclohexadiene carboxylate dehydrogenase
MTSFEKKIALVTGAAQGVGRATARMLARRGATVVLVDRSADLCESAQREIQSASGSAIALGANLETYEGADAVVRQILDRFGMIDISVHNVGGTIWAKPFWEYDPEQILAEFSRSLFPTVWCCRAVVPVMKERGAGAIVNIGSAATRWLLRVPYSAAKGGVHAMTVCMARELADSGVRVNCVSPGALATHDRITPRNPSPLTQQEEEWRQQAYDQSLRDTPQGRPGSVEEVAAAVCFLASDEASYITGQVLFVAGGAVG